MPISSYEELNNELLQDTVRDARIVSREEVESELKKSGIIIYGSKSLQQNGTFIQLFLFNSEQNHAADPVPFRIAPAAIDKIAKTAIGRPWIVAPDYSKHVRGGFNDPKQIIEYQKRFAKGEIVTGWRNPSSTNVNMIAQVFPQYATEVKMGLMPKSPYVSPLIFVKSQSNGQILDGEVLHVQSVNQPGYDPEIARISGMCDGMLGQCMNELRALGAAAREEEKEKPVGFELEESFTDPSKRRRQR